MRWPAWNARWSIYVTKLAKSFGVSRERPKVQVTVATVCIASSVGRLIEERAHAYLDKRTV